MAIQYINTGSSANAGDGDSLRSAFIKVNNNFSYLSTTTGAGGNGYTGSQGVRGYTGSKGADGTNGYTGSRGQQGDPGVGTTSYGGTGQLPFYSTSGTTLSPVMGLSYTTATNLFSIGNNLHDGNLYVIRNSSTLTSMVTFAQHHDQQDAANFTFLRTRGTSLSRTAVQLGDEIAEISFTGNDGTNSVNGFVVGAVVDVAPTTGSIPMKLRFSGDRTRNGNISTLMELSSTGTLSINRITNVSTADDDITVEAHIIPRFNSLYNLGSTSNQWHSLYVSSSTIYLGGVALGISNNQLTVNGSPIQTTSLVTASNTPPENATTGTLWYDDVSGRTYIYYDDSWVDTNPTVVGYTGSGGLGYTGSAGAGYTGSQGTTGYTGSAATLSTLVNGTWTVSLSVNGTLTSPLRNDDSVTATNVIVNYNPVTRELTTSSNYFNTNTLVTNAISATTATTAGRLGNLRVVTAPASLIGTSTNVVGDIAFDGTYFYYCSGTFTSATNNIILSQEENFTNPTATIHFTKGAITPQIGWTLYASFSTWTITGVTDNGAPTETWSIDISGLGGGSYSFSTGTVFIMTNPNPGSIWQRTPWNAITGTGTAARATTSTYASTILTESVPTSSTSTGVKGQIAVNSTSMYVCVATNSWLRFAGATF